ncbi:MAG TPA: hypothetical protein VHA37_04010, partial [Candidatus Saccharimonadales bacterium]|nr:hypothetical protein [Candidatus Saccharimonadales bacterium]
YGTDMKKQPPGLEIFLPVQNVGPEQTREFRRRLRMRHLGEEGTSAAIRRLTKPSREPRAYLALPGEVRGLQRRARVRRPSEAHMTELKEYVDETIPESWRQWTIQTPTFPLRFERQRHQHREEILSIAGCEQVLKARRLMKHVLANFYGMEKPPKGLWVEDVTAARPVIARAHGADSIDLLYELGSEIELSKDHALLPRTTELGGVVTELIMPESDPDS